MPQVGSLGYHDSCMYGGKCSKGDCARVSFRRVCIWLKEREELELFRWEKRGEKKVKEVKKKVRMQKLYQRYQPYISLWYAYFFHPSDAKIFCRVKGAFFHSLAWYLEHRFQFLAGAHHCSLLFHLVKKCWGFKLVTEIYTHRSSSAQSNKLSSLGIETSPVAVQSRSFIWKKNKQISK